MPDSTPSHLRKPDRQLVCIDPVTLTAILQQSNLPRITHHQFRNMRLQQIVQPASPGTFFKRNAQISKSPRSPWINSRMVLALVGFFL
jgi:hypothetical protein